MSIFHFGRRFSNPRFHDHLLSDSVRNVKNVKALWEWLKYWLFVWDQFGFEKSHRNRNFGFDLLASVRFGFLKTETEPKFGFRTSLNSNLPNYSRNAQKQSSSIHSNKITSQNRPTKIYLSFEDLNNLVNDTQFPSMWPPDWTVGVIPDRQEKYKEHVSQWSRSPWNTYQQFTFSLHYKICLLYTSPSPRD